MTPDKFHLMMSDALKALQGYHRRVFKIAGVVLAVLATLSGVTFAVAQNAFTEFDGVDTSGYAGTSWTDNLFDYGQVTATLEVMQSSVTALSDKVAGMATSLLFALLAIDIVLLFGRSILASEELGPMLSKFIYRLLFVGLCFFILVNAVEIITWLSGKALEISRSAAQGANVNFTEPSVAGIMTDAARDALAMIGKVEWNPGTWLFLFAGLVQIVVSTMMAAILVVSTLELFLVGILGMFALGFAGLEVASGSASLYIKSMIGKALKLMGLMLLWSLTTGFTSIIVSSAGVNPSTAVAIMMALILSAVLLMTLPPSIEGLAGGIGSSAAGAVAGGFAAWAAGRGAAATGGAALGAGAGAISGALKGGIQGASGGLGGAAQQAALGAMKGGLTKGAQYAGSGLTRGVGGVASRAGADAGSLGKATYNKIKEIAKKGGE